MEFMLSCFLFVCAISISAVQGGTNCGWIHLRIPGRNTELVDIRTDMTIRELRELVAERIGKDVNTIVMRYAQQLLSDDGDGDGAALLAGAGVTAESVVDAAVGDFQEMLLEEYHVPIDADYRSIFKDSIKSYPEEGVDKRKIDLLARLLLQGSQKNWNLVCHQIYNAAFFHNKDCSLIEHFFDEFPDHTRESFAQATARPGSSYALTFYVLFDDQQYPKTGITLKLIRQIYDAFERYGLRRDINKEIEGRTSLEYVLEADDTQFARGDEERQEIVQFMRSKGAVDRSVLPAGVRRLIDIQEKEV